MIRPLSRDDLTLLKTVQRRCFAAVWSETQWIAYLENKRSVGLLMLRDHEPLGFALFSTLFDEAELLQIGIDPDHRGNGLGRQLLLACHTVLQQRQISRVMLEVRSSNRSAIALYTGLGYLQDGMRKGYYAGDNGREDAILMSYSNPDDSTVS